MMAWSALECWYIALIEGQFWMARKIKFDVIDEWMKELALYKGIIGNAGLQKLKTCWRA